MDRQTLRDWCIGSTRPGRTDCAITGRAPDPPLSGTQGELAAIVEAGPNREVDGVVRWRASIFSASSRTLRVDYCERYVGTLLKKLGFAHISARPPIPPGRRDRRGFQKNFPRA